MSTVNTDGMAGCHKDSLQCCQWTLSRHCDNTCVYSWCCIYKAKYLGKLLPNIILCRYVKWRKLAMFWDIWQYKLMFCLMKLYPWGNIGDSVKYCGISFANAIEILQSCTKPCIEDQLALWCPLWVDKLTADLTVEHLDPPWCHLHYGFVIGIYAWLSADCDTVIDCNLVDICQLQIFINSLRPSDAYMGQ